MKFLNRIVILIITIYKKFISPILPPTCRFTPSCSEYSYQAFRKYNFPKAFILSAHRILRCHPFHSGGYDPLP
ncbi:MAG: membrane protein insertion efficiency factor YidD [Candidatus Cloacimonetes bacterium]|nr:membrane protein insertion efficiency factor YidD [Candidatus Cloacimonadota bacterium]